MIHGRGILIDREIADRSGLIGHTTNLNFDRDCQISRPKRGNARDMQIALIYTVPGDCCLARLATASQIEERFGVWRTCLSIDCHALQRTTPTVELDDL